MMGIKFSQHNQTRNITSRRTLEGNNVPLDARPAGRSQRSAGRSWASRWKAYFTWN